MRDFFAQSISFENLLILEDISFETFGRFRTWHLTLEGPSFWAAMQCRKKLFGLDPESGGQFPAQMRTEIFSELLVQMPRRNRIAQIYFIALCAAPNPLWGPESGFGPRIWFPNPNPQSRKHHHSSSLLYWLPSFASYPSGVSLFHFPPILHLVPEPESRFGTRIDSQGNLITPQIHFIVLTFI